MEENKYKDILKGIVEIIQNAEHSDIGFASICTYIGDHCPELGESEDEQTRKQLLDLVHRYTLAPYSDRHRWVAYLEKLKDFDKQLLEKQGEQSKEVTYTHEVETGNGNIKALVTEKVQLPKFKVGDFIVNDYCMGRVVEITNDAYLLDTGQGIPFSCEHNAHLWSISDAKDGDVLAIDEIPVIFKRLVKGSNSIEHIDTYCRLEDGVEQWEFRSSFKAFRVDGADVTPATKEQRELLSRKMKEAGYEWNPATKLSHKEVTKKSEQEWTEEDDELLGDVITACHEYYGDFEPWPKINSWLKSLEQRMTWKPTGEQINALEWQVNNTAENSWQCRNSKELLEQLKRLL